MTSDAGDSRTANARVESALPVQVMRNLLTRYMDRNRAFYTEEFLVEAQAASEYANTR